MTDSPFPPHPLPLDGVATPRFFDWKTAPVRWELLCTRLLDRDPRYGNADLFEIGGVKQYGIDAIADIREGGRVALSAKCYEATTKAGIRSWSNDFLEHYDDYWNARDVRTFILAVAAPDIVRAPIRDQIELETQRFAALGLTYEIWGPEPVYDRIRREEDLVTRFLGEGWRTEIFGPRVTSGGTVDAALIRQLAETQDLASAQIGIRLTEGSEYLRCGERDRVADLVKTVTQPAVWSVLTVPVKAQALRLAARQALDDGDLKQASDLAASAAALEPRDPILEARIVQETDGAAAALRALGDVTTPDGRRYQASLHLGLGQTDEAAALLDDLDPASDPAEIARLRAYLQLARQDYGAALDHAKTAAAIAPGRISVQLIHAIALYASGISPSTPPAYTIHALVPPENLVRQDAASVASRRKALDAFKAILEHWRGDASVIEDWVLVCLSCLPDREDDAKAWIDRRLASDPADRMALLGALARDHDVDVAAAIKVLLSRLDTGTADPAELQLLVQLHVATRATDGLAERLEAATPTLDGPSAEAAAEFIQALRAPPELITDPVAQLAQWLQSAPPAAEGLQLAGTLAAQRRWSDLQPHLSDLAKFRTQASASLIIFTTAQTDRPERVLEAIDRHAEDFFEGRLPLDIRRLRLNALGEVDTPQAIRTSQALVAETDHAQDRRYLVRLLLAAGTVQSALPHIRRLLSDGDLEAGDAIRYSAAAVGEDPQLATTLWRHAVLAGVPDVYLLHAVTLGYRLGLDLEVAPLMPRMQARAASDAGDVWQVSTDDLPALMLQRREELQDVQIRMLDGTLPVHLATRGPVGSLADLYRLEPLARPGPQPLVLIRNGGRSADLQAPDPWADWQIVMDPTGLLVADQLDLLDHVEALAKPTLISRSLLDVLYELERDAAHGQPARVEAARRVIEALANGRLASARDLAAADCVVHEREPDAEGHTIQEVAAALADDDADGGLQPGQRLVFTEGTLAALAMETSLEAVTVRCKCEIDPDDLADANTEIRAAEEGAKAALRLRALRERVALGVTTGRYQYLPDTHGPSEDDDVEAGEEDTDGAPAVKRRTPLETCLMNNLSAPGGPGRVVWIDDRMTSGYRRSQDNPIVTVVEVLNALLAAGRITPTERHATLLTLRRGGAAFIPMEAGEILEPLRAAVIRGGEVLETDPLRILRRNLASAARLDRHLSILLDGSRSNEQPFLSTQMRLLEDCLRAVWSEADVSLETRRARSDWLWSNLRLERCVRPLPVDQPADGNRIMASVTFASLFTLGFHIDAGDYAGRLERRKAYMDWASQRMLAPRSGPARTTWVDRMIEQLRALYSSTFEIPVKPKDLDLIRKVRHDEIDALPDRLKRPLLEDEAFADAVGMTSVFRTSAGPHKFDSQAFWSAAARAIRRGKTTVRSTTGAVVAMSWVRGALKVAGPPATMMDIPFAQALVQRGPPRRAAIETYLRSLELTPDALDRFLPEATRTRSKLALIQSLLRARKSVVADHYEEIDEALERGTDIPIETLYPPPARAALHAMRLEGEGPLPDRARRAWSELAKTFSADEALRRLGGLPTDLADLLSLESPPHLLSPIAAVHLAAARRRAGQSAEASLALILDVPDEAQGLLLDLVAWTRNAYASEADWRGLPADDRLALCWSHAHRLVIMIQARTTDFAGVRQRFRDSRPAAPVEDELVGDPQFTHDQAGPGLLRPSSLTYHGLAYVLGDEADWTSLPVEQQGRIAQRILAFAPDQIGPEVGLLLAGPTNPNAMQSWLGRQPRGLLTPDLSPTRIRERHLRDALAEIETGSGNLDAWRMASLLVRGSDAAESDRFSGAVAALDFRSLGASAEGRLVAQVAIDGQGFRPHDDDALLVRLHTLAAGAAPALPGPIKLDSPSSSGLLNPLIMALISGARTGDEQATLRRLRLGAISMAHAWPELAAVFRPLFERWYSQADPRADDLWEAFIEFRAWA